MGWRKWLLFHADFGGENNRKMTKEDALSFLLDYRGEIEKGIRGSR